jgi:hypothetical protein
VSSTSSQATTTSTEPTENKETKQVDSGSTSSSTPLVNTNVPKLSFNDIDLARTVDNQEEKIVAPKTIERLDEISEIRSIQRKQDELEDEDDVKIKIIEDQNVDLNDLGLGIEDINEPEMKLVSDLLGDIEVLE